MTFVTLILSTLLSFSVMLAGAGLIAQTNCSPAYKDVCIPPPPPDLNCGDISHRNFRVYRASDADKPAGLTGFDPHKFDSNDDGIGCERRR